MTKFRALLVSTLLAGSMTVGALAATSTTTDAKAPTKLRDGSSWCC